MLNDLLPRHAVIVTLDCDGTDHPGEPHDNWDCFRREVECPAITPQCEAWGPCGKTPECSDSTWPDDDDYVTFHGVEHRFMRHDSYWGVPQGTCFYAVGDNTPDAIADLELNEPGRYEIDVDMDDIYPLFTLATEMGEAP